MVVLAVAFVAMILTPTTLSAQGTVRQSGTVTDEDGKGLEGVKVVAVHAYSKKETETFTDAEGQFAFPRLSDGVTVFVFSKDGYKTNHQQKNLIAGQRVRPIRMKLEVDPEFGKPTEEDFTKAANLVRERKFKEASEIFLRFTEAYPELSAAWINLGVCQISLNDFAGAAETFDHVLTLEPDNYAVMMLAAQAYTQLRKFPEAIAYYEKYLEAQPTNIESWQALGQIYNIQEKRDKALACFDKVLELNANHAEALMMKGYTLIDLERTDEAVAVLEQFLTIQSTGANANKVKDVLANHYLDKGKKQMEALEYEQAIISLQKYLELKPDASDAEEVRAMIQAAQEQLQ